MGWLWEGSTGARAVQLLRELPQGGVIFTNDFAARLGVKPGALHQLLANAVNLRLIKKVRGLGPSIGWKLGAGNVNATIERRRTQPPATPEERARRQQAAQRRAQRAADRAAPPARPAAAVNWPPGFVSSFGPSYRLPRIAPADADDAPAAAADVALPGWLAGLVPGTAHLPPPPPAQAQTLQQRPEQLQLFDAREIGEPGRQRGHRARAAAPAADAAPWQQTTFLEPAAA